MNAVACIVSDTRSLQIVIESGHLPTLHRLADLFAEQESSQQSRACTHKTRDVRFSG